MVIQASPSCTGILRAGQRLRDRGDAVDHGARHDPRQQAQQREAQHGGDGPGIGFPAPEPRPRCGGGRGRRCRTPARSRRRPARRPGPAARHRPGSSASGPIAADRGAAGSAWKVSHSEAKPFSGGRAEIADAADQEGERGRGMRWISPPMISMSRSPVAFSTAPAPKNSRLLNTVWLSAWNSAAVSAKRRSRLEAIGAERQRQPQADENDADVLHRRDRRAAASGRAPSAHAGRRARR